MVVTIGAGTPFNAFQISGVDCVFQLYEIDQGTNSSSTTNNWAVGNAAAIVKTTQPQVMQFAMPTGPLNTNSGDGSWAHATFKFAIKAKQTGTCLITYGKWSAPNFTTGGTLGFSYNKVELHIRVLDRPSSYPQGSVYQVSNPTWLT